MVPAPGSAHWLMVKEEPEASAKCRIHKRAVRESSSYQPPWRAPGFEHLLVLALGTGCLPESC